MARHVTIAPTGFDPSPPPPQIQQLTIDRAMFAPIMDLRALFGIGPEMADHAMNIVPMTAFRSYQDMKLKGQ
jgi:peptide/nickel transport system substrate-binding protein